MSELQTTTKVERKGLLAGQMASDSLVLAIAASVLTAFTTGGGLVSAILTAFVTFLGFFLLALVVQVIFNSSRETLRRKLMGWATFSLVLYWLYSDWIADLEIYFSVGAFAFTAIHTLFLHRRQDAEFRSEKAEKAGNLQLAEHLAQMAQDKGMKALPDSLMQSMSNLPPDLDPEVQALVNGSIEDFLHLHDLISDPLIAADQGSEHEALHHEATEVLTEVLHRAPLISRLTRVASKRNDDPKGQAAAKQALARLRKQADALHEAASAALLFAASASGDATRELREHVEGLNALREARGEVERVLAE